jgi:dCTP diphosphatase
MAEDSLIGIRERMRVFTRERDWEQFHDPKSLALALVGEVGELTELLQWLSAERVGELARQEPLNSRLGEELSDVLLYLVRLADVCGVHLGEAVDLKLGIIGTRFEPSQFRGIAPQKG